VKAARERHSYYWKPKKKTKPLTQQRVSTSKKQGTVPNDPGTNEQAKKLKI